MLNGRQEIINKHEAKKVEGLNKREGLVIDHLMIICQRCGSRTAKEHARLEKETVYYCPRCIQYGRLTSEDWLVWGETNDLIMEKQRKKVVFSWKGKLTKAQQVIANALLVNEVDGVDTLVWAVTGAGKTEMIFPLIQQVLSKQGRVAICSPRIDVCRELYPRISEVFPEEKTLLLHGGSEEHYRYTNLMVCTMHQLFYFYHSFDLIVIDEVDAFPYEGDKQLSFGCRQALKPEGHYVYLTATPSKFLLNNLREKTIHLTLPRRYHGRDLPVPKVVWQNHWENPANYFFKRKLCLLIEELLESTFVLVFCPSISYMQNLFQELKEYFPDESLVSIHAEDELRKEKVANVRSNKYQVVLTTTILERGVTFERVSVLVLGANHPVYTKSALVQISGRVDRKGSTANGKIYFVCNRWTKAIKLAIAEIQLMNKKARLENFL